MNKIIKTANNEQGFVLVASLMMLTILMIIGIAATNTTTLELQISGNDKLSKQVFYQAEGVAAEAARNLMNAAQSGSGQDLENPNLFQWLHLNPNVAGLLTVSPNPAPSENTDVHSDAIWNNTNTVNSGTSQLPTAGVQGLRMMATFRGLAPGSSLDVDSSRLHNYDIYGRSQQSNALSIIKLGCRIPF